MKDNPASNKVRLMRKGSVVAQTAGALKGTGRAVTVRQERRAFEEAVAADVVRRMGKSRNTKRTL